MSTQIKIPKRNEIPNHLLFIGLETPILFNPLLFNNRNGVKVIKTKMIETNLKSPLTFAFRTIANRIIPKKKIKKNPNFQSSIKKFDQIFLNILKFI